MRIRSLPRWSALVGLAWVATAGAGVAQQVRVQARGPDPAVVKLGDAATVQVVFEGATQAPPAPEFPPVDGLRIEVTGPPSSMTRASYDGRTGRMVRSATVTWSFRVQPERPGRFEIPAFEVATGTGTSARIGPLQLECVTDTRGSDFGFLEVTPSQRTVYVHEPLVLTVEYGVDKRVEPVKEAVRTGRGVVEVYRYDLMGSWLGGLEGTEPLDAEPPAGLDDRKVPLVVGDQVEQVPFDSQFTRDGRAFYRFVLRRRYLPTRPGQLSIPRTVLRFQVPSGRERLGLFGERLGRTADTLFCYADPLEVTVLPLPEAGRPATFSGGVGRFTLASTVDRRSVRVGDSVKWTLEVRGQGNLRFLGLPELPKLEGWHLLGRNENRDEEVAAVTFDVAPLSEDAPALPAVEWAFFDTSPQVESYRSVRSEAIPIVVEPLPDGETLGTLPDAADDSVVPGVDDIHDIRPIERLAASAPPSVAPPAPLWRWLVVVGPWVLALAVWSLTRLRARVSADPIGRRARAARGAFRAAQRAGRSADEALVAYLAARLGVAEAAVIGQDLDRRLTRAGCSAELADAARAAVDAGVAARYGGGAPPDAGEVERLVDRLERESITVERGSGFAAPALLLFALATAGGLGAQAADPAGLAEQGQRAYRDGEYARAAAAWERALARPDADPRLAYNLGNARYRTGDLAGALVAWETARLALPRDAELAANLALARRQLDVRDGASDAPFTRALAELRGATTPAERWWACLVLHCAAAALVVFGRGTLRWIGGGLAIPALALAVELLVVEPGLAPRAVVTGARVEMRAEPRADRDAVATLKRGLEVEVLGRGPDWTRIAVGDRRGYVPSASLGWIGLPLEPRGGR